MSSEEPPFLEEAHRTAEAKLSRVLGSPCKISIHLHLDDKLFRIIKEVELEMFREELRYTKEELEDRVNLKGFIFFIATVDDKPISLLFGYNDPAIQNGFYLDTLASVLEGKGVGSTLVALLMIYCYEAGYNLLSLNTEELDEKKRPLRKFYESIGFQFLYTDPNDGDLLRVQITPDKVTPIYKKFIAAAPSQSQQTPSSNQSIT